MIQFYCYENGKDLRSIWLSFNVSVLEEKTCIKCAQIEGKTENELNKLQYNVWFYGANSTGTKLFAR